MSLLVIASLIGLAVGGPLGAIAGFMVGIFICWLFEI